MRSGTRGAQDLRQLCRVLAVRALARVQVMPGLGRLIEFDERSRRYPVRALVEGRKPRSYTWGCDLRLDQGDQPACVGFSMAHELRAKPKVVSGVTTELAMTLYREAQELDEWPGTSYEGTSVLAGVKALQKRGFIESYAWAFGLAEVVLALSYVGPVVAGTSWDTSMFEPASCGYLHPNGKSAGGHAYLLVGVDMKRERLRILNSWSSGWADGGMAWISFADMQNLLSRQGEACLPLQRKFTGIV